MPRCLALVLLLALAPLLAPAAPVPRVSPPPLTAEGLVGTWGYQYGGMCDGSITFYPDHSYQAFHDEGGQKYIGLWRVEGGSVVLDEYGFCPARNEVRYGPSRYVFAFAAVAPDRLAGATAGGGCPVVLTRPKE